MKEIPLSQGYSALVDEDDVERLSQHLWHITRCGNRIYATASHRSGRERMHRMVLNAPKGVDVDHINGDGLDNRRCNLRLCTRSENNLNRRKHGRQPASRYKGVTKNRARWSAQARHTYLGMFDTEIEAARAYDDYAKKHYGEFARLNFPE